jgi:hypothetical protein|tara:strand:+ start:695 stop:883 length:189 start_codon:yes stop_codon:yes gene_type:complete
MDKFFEKLFAKIAEFHEKEIEFTQSLVDTPEDVPKFVLESTPKEDFYIREFIKLNKEHLPQA